MPSIGGFFAYVSFPEEYILASACIGLKRKRLGSEDVGKVLAERFGVVTLPGGFFMPDLETLGSLGEGLKQDRWLRFAVANIEDDVVLKLAPRLRRMNKLMGMD